MVHWYSPGYASVYPHLIHASLDPPESESQMASPSVQPFVYISRQSRYTLQRAATFPLKFATPIGASGPQSNTWFLWPTWFLNKKSISIASTIFVYNGPLFSPSKLPPFDGGSGPTCNTWFLGLSEPITQTASRSVQPFLHISRQNIPIVYNEPAFPHPQNCPFPWGDLDPYLIHGSFTRVPNPNGTSIGWAIFAGFITVTDRQTDRPRYSICNYRPHLHAQSCDAA